MAGWYLFQTRRLVKIRLDKLDILFSKYVRTKAGWRCERCGNTPKPRGLHCHHFHRRRKKSTRYDEDNCIALCRGCHQYLGENRDEEEALMVQRLGQERFDLLNVRAEILVKPDREAIRLYIKNKLRELDGD